MIDIAGFLLGLLGGVIIGLVIMVPIVQRNLRQSRRHSQFSQPSQPSQFSQQSQQSQQSQTPITDAKRAAIPKQIVDAREKGILK